MALNCPDRSDDGEPCGRCDSCARIWGGHTSLDVVEIDAASNRGVDDARDLRERAMYAPSEADRYKVYILDEAHMLTREAWNALLKIIEEPPPRVIFVFATTEPNKIQQTASPILSRCQRFDFRRIGSTDIVSRLEDVLETEKATGSTDALRIIARKADGGMRDALSLLDQVLALSEGRVDADSVRQVLGLVEEERYLALFDLLLESRRGEIFSFIDRLLDEGYDLAEFYVGLVETLRSLLQLRMEGGGAPDLRDDLIEEFRKRADAFEPGDLVRMLAMAAELETTGSLRRSGQPRMLLELLLLRFSYIDRTIELEELIRALGGASERPEGRDHEGEIPSTAAVSLPIAAGERGAGEESRASDPVTEAWRKVLDSGTGLPSGLRSFLLGANVREAPPGTIQIHIPPGPGRERLEHSSVRRGLADRLGAELGRSVEVRVDDGGEGTPDDAHRITQEAVRKDRLKELYSREPLLERAVEELDLELLE
jgi:DNA polymerase-3 subunit gamma/tau